MAKPIVKTGHYTKIKKITVKMTKKTKAEIPKAVIDDGYNLREKSKWVVAAVEDFVKKPVKDIEGALVSELLTNTLDTHDVFSLPTDLVTEINQVSAKVVLEHPGVKPSQSSIIRAAISRKLLNLDELFG